MELAEAQDLLVLAKANWATVTCNQATANAWHIMLQSVDFEDAKAILCQAAVEDRHEPVTPKYILSVISSARRRGGQLFISSGSRARADATVVADILQQARDSLKKPCE